MRDELEGIEITLVETLDEAREFLDWLASLPEGVQLAIDTETIGLNWWEPNFVRLVQFGTRDRAYCLGAREWWQVIYDALARVRDRGIPVVFHNCKFDMHALEVSGWPVPEWPYVGDTMIMDHLCYPIRSHALKQMGRRVYGKWATVGQQMLDAYHTENGTDWATVPVGVKAYWAYGGLDTVLTARFAESLWHELMLAGRLSAYMREMAVSAITYRMESRGLPVDLAYTSQLKEKWEVEMTELKLQLDVWGVKNPSSAADLIDALQRKEGWEPTEFTDKGAVKTSKSVLSKLDSQIVPLVLRYKRLQKWTSAYLDHFLESGGLTHPEIKTMGARTGRMSITRPAMQTLPSDDPTIRRCILPPAGARLWATDYDAQELRLMAHFSQDPGLLSLFESGQDPHKLVASAVYGVPVSEVEDWQRKRSKNVAFARAYGAREPKIAETAGLSIEEVTYFTTMYDLNYPGVSKFMDETINEGRLRAMNEGEPYITTAGGRWVNTEPDKLYTLVNYLIQGSGADLLKMKIVELDKAGLADNVMLPVHDELLFQFPEGEADAPYEAARIMEEHEMFSLPLTCHTSGPLEAWG
jgi:DNA polymerase-1